MAGSPNFGPRSIRVSFLLLLLAGLPLTQVCIAQTAAVTGLVVDPSNSVVPNAQITLTEREKGVTLHSSTNSTGVFSLPFVQPGTYVLEADAAGFMHYTKENISIAVAQRLNLDVQLQMQGSSQSITVDGNSIEINTSDASVSTVVDQQFVKNIPLNGRSFQSLLALIPGATVVPSQGVGISGEMTVNGQRPEANYYMVDGVSANTGASTVSTGNGGGFSGNTPGQTALGTTQGMVSVDALEEFRANTSTYSAEYGRTPGGQFSFNTRSGTNDWHGSAYEYFRNDALDATNWFNNDAGIPKSRERQNDFGGTLGGPIRIPHLYNGRDKTFFFFSYEGLRLRAPQPATFTNVPDLNLRQSAAPALQPFLNAFPLPNGPEQTDGLAMFTSGFSNPSTMDSKSIRIDHNLSSRFKLFGRYSDTPSDSDSRGSSNLAIIDTTVVNVKTVTLGLTSMLSSRLSNDLRANVTGNDSSYLISFDNFGGATPLSTATLPNLEPPNWFLFSIQYGLVPNIYIRPLTNRQRQLNITDSFAFSLGRHNLKWGLDIRRLVNSEFLPPVVQYGYFYSSQRMIHGTADQAILLKFSAPAKPIYANYSTYIQDEWKVSQRLSLSLGLRWDINPPPTDGNGNLPYTITSTDLATTQLAPKGTPLWATTYGNFAPRLGVAYQLNSTSGRETVVRTGFGVFYDSGNIQGSEGYNGIGYYGQTTRLGQSFPLTQTEIDNGATASTEKPYSALISGFDPHLQLPRVYEWNLSLQQSLGTQQAITASYVGSAGRRLLVQRYYYPNALGNQNFTSGIGMYLTTNDGYSDFHSFQLQFQRKLSSGLQALLSYTFSHSTDNNSSNFAVYKLLHASSNFDVRNNFQAAVTYDIPGTYSNSLSSILLKGWALDGRVAMRSGFPVDITGAYDIDPLSGSYLYYQPNRVSGEPLYLHNASAPAGRILNYDAFTIPTDSSNHPVQGNAGRNLARGFDSVQTDLALRREFHIHEQLGVQFRLESFNLFNHPIFGDIYSSRATNTRAQFGRAYDTQNSQLGGLNSLFQSGGPRSLQLALRLHF